jgi:hypothetical protein
MNPTEAKNKFAIQILCNIKSKKEVITMYEVVRLINITIKKNNFYLLSSFFFLQKNFFHFFFSFIFPPSCKKIKSSCFLRQLYHHRPSSFCLMNLPSVFYSFGRKMICTVSSFFSFPRLSLSLHMGKL